MSMCLRIAALATLCCVCAFQGEARAQAPSPLDLVRGLREADMPDLALEYLEKIEKTNPTGDLKVVLPLERARVRLDLAEQEEDEGAKDAGIARARTEFQAFLKANPKHPRAPEASGSLARVIALQANIQLARAGRLPVEQRKAAAAAVRPRFREAANLFRQASTQLNAQLNNDQLEAFRKRDLQREALQAELDFGINLFRMADTFDTGNPNEVIERGKVIEEARAAFDALWKKAQDKPVGWVARAFTGACYVELSEKAKAEEVFRAIRSEAPRNPAGADGVRMVDFFEIQDRFLTARGAAQLVRPTREQVRIWLDRDKYKSRMTPERISAMVYYAELSEMLALQSGITFDKDNKLKDVSPTARSLLQEANVTFKRLAEIDSQYTERAASGRTRVIRLLVGNADQPPAQFKEFEQCHMAALVKLSEAGQAKDEQARAEQTSKAIALLERCRELATPNVPIKDVSEAAVQLAFAYLNGGRVYEAAVLGEYLARFGRPTSNATKGGFLGVQGYLTAMSSPTSRSNDDAKEADRERALALAEYVDKTYPNDPLTDAIRFRLGRLYFDERDLEQAFNTFSKIGPGYSSLAAARLMQGRAAYALVVDKESSLSDTQKAQIFRKAVTDAEAVPEPAASANKDEVGIYVALRTLLPQLYILNREYAKAEQIATETAKKIQGLSQLDESAKKASEFAAREVRLRALYAQAYPLYESKDYKGLGERLIPVLTDLAKSGPANVDLDGSAAVAADALDRARLQIITLALQGNIREGGDAAAELFGLLEKFGGRADVLVSLVAQVKPQIDELRKENNAEAADKLVASLSAILEKQSGDDKLTARTRARIGGALRSIGAHDKAIAVLSAMAPAPDEELRKPINQLQDPEIREQVIAHHISRLELARAYRGAKQFDQADQVLKDALGEDQKPGWTRSLEYRRESVLLLEDRAEAGPADQQLANWKAALDGWTQIVREYQTAVTRPPKEAAKDPARMEAWQRDREKIIPIYLGVYCDLQRCLARANTKLIADPAKRAEKLLKIGETVHEVESINEKGLSTEVIAAYSELLQDFPSVREGYEKAGGKLFLNAPAPPEASGN